MNRIKELRIKRNLNMKQIANELNIPYTTYVNYEKGEREPNSEMLLALANYFNCSVDYLIGRSNEQIDESVLDIINTIDNELLEKHGNIYHALKEQQAIDQYEISQDIKMINKYHSLDLHGQDLVSTILEKEYTRCKSDKTRKKKPPTVEINHSVYKVSAGTGYMLEDSDSWETIEIPDAPEARRADFALTIQGDSMEPIYFDGDIVLVQRQDAIDLGEVGIFIVNGDGYIKKYGGDRLISLNAAYKDIKFFESDEIKCIGKVIGRA